MLHFLAQSQSCLEYLLESTSTSLINSTLTIWGTDDITNEELEALKSFIKSIGKHRTYIDTAFDLDGNNQQKSNSNVVKKESKSFTIVTIVLVMLFGVGILAAIGFWYYKKKHSNLPPSIPNVNYILRFGQIPQHMVPNDHYHQ